MGRAIAIANQKGGVGKTTTAINLGACLALEGKSVLLIDLDPQGNASSGLGVDRRRLKRCVYNVLMEEEPVEKVMVGTRIPDLMLVPATLQLAGAEVEMANLEEREYLLRKSIEAVRKEFDFVIVDCPPSLGLLTINALAACDSLLIPIQCEYYALEGLGQLMQTVNLVRQRVNPGLKIEGILLTMFVGRTNLCIQVVEEVKKHFGRQVYRTIIPRSVRLAEAPGYGKPVVLYDPRSRGAEVYTELAKEVLARG